MTNVILNTDSYKTSHYLQYPENTQYVSSYIEARGGAYDRALFFGLQIYLKKVLSKPISQTDIDEAEIVLNAHGVPFNRAGWEYILSEYQGYLPIQIEAVEEGSLIPIQNVLLQVVNTDPACAWLTSYIETSLLRALWYPVTVATLSNKCREIIGRYMANTADSIEGLPFKLHDFGARGVSSEEAAAIGGAAHLVSFSGTDTLNAITATRQYYAADMAGFSIPAAEHSTITSWGRDGETQAYANMLEQFSGEGKIVAVVSDSYDLWNAIDNIWGDELKHKVESTGGTLVVRPDSGDPVSVVCETIERLIRKFGCITNKRGFRVLPDCVRVIQGDGISSTTIEAILEAMCHRKLSAENIAFGMGGELLQKVNRDTMQFAMKASAVCVDGLWRDVYKDPITDSKKRSKKGVLALVKDNRGEFRTIRKQDLGKRENLLKPVFRNGELLKDFTFDEVRERAQLA